MSNVCKSENNIAGIGDFVFGRVSYCRAHAIVGFVWFLLLLCVVFFGSRELFKTIAPCGGPFCILLQFMNELQRIVVAAAIVTAWLINCLSLAISVCNVFVSAIREHYRQSTATAAAAAAESETRSLTYNKNFHIYASQFAHTHTHIFAGTNIHS